ncbi:MAG: hypothetical protein ACI97A_003891 [Planctomycetota bacterium]|jgi:hypothetical protein
MNFTETIVWAFREVGWLESEVTHLCQAHKRGENMTGTVIGQQAAI